MSNEDLDRSVHALVGDFKSSMDEIIKKSTPVIKDILGRFLTEDSCFEYIWWNQYTPHYNDGDTSRFRIDGFYFGLKSEVCKEISEIIGPDRKISKDIDVYSFTRPLFKEIPFIRRMTGSASALDTLADDTLMMRLLFGENVKVWVTSTSIKIEPYNIYG